MKRQIGFLSLILFFLFLFFPVERIFCAPYYEGKRITIIVGSEAGGGYDRISRTLAKHLPKYIPGNPTIIVENMVGAGSIVAANHVYSIAKPDGLTIGAPQRGLPFAQLTKTEGVRFDLMKFSWIGSAASESAILCVRSDLPYKTFDDLLKIKDPIYLYAVGPSTTDYQFPTLLKEFVGLKVKLVIYPSSSAGMLAVERKEVDGGVRSFTAFKPFIERGLIRPLIRGRASEPGIEHLPVDEDLAMDKKGKMIMAMRSAGDLIGRPYVTSPGTPAEIINILREAFVKVTKDPELIEESKKLMLTLEYTPPEECLKVLKEIFSQPEDIVAEFGKYIKF